jgi:protein involved in polysaccharide export with SLBB domain
MFMKQLNPSYYFILLVFFWFVCNNVQAQQLPASLSKIHVDNLSDAQIRQLMQEASNEGLSDTQLLQTARERGLPPDELRSLQNRINSINGKTGTTSYTTDSLHTGRALNYKRSTDTLSKKEVIDLFSPILPKLFAADIFTNSDQTFAPDLKLATPKNYVVGPEDQLNISIYGNSTANWKLDVSPEGNINLPVAGILNVTGKTIEQVTADIKRRLIAYHFAVGNGTSVQVNLGNIRSIKVIMIGNLKKPGTYTLPSLATAFNALYAAGGPNDKGSFRQIEIIRNNRIIRVLDIYGFLTKGDQKNNIGLQDQDIIRVPTYRTHVEMSGEVNTPAIFEVLPGETLNDVLNFAGGFTDQAYTDQIKVYQVSNQQRRITDIKNANYKTYIPQRGDRYVVDKILERFENRVNINGAVFRPGDYELENGLTVSKLIEKAAGLKEDAFTSRGSISRLNPDNSRKLIPFDVRGILNRSVADISLQREDSVYIASVFELRDKYTVIIKGDVRKGGTFIYADSMKVSDLIIKAGGFVEGASVKRVEVARRRVDSIAGPVNNKTAIIFSVNLDPNLKISDKDFTLQPYDIVSVYSLPDYEKQRTVKVEGEVQYPGYYALQGPGDKISDVIIRAGNLKPSADAFGASLMRSNTAILGIDKNKADSTLLLKDRLEKLKHLQRSLKDSATVDNEQVKNNYIGINLPEILKTPGTITDLMLEDGDVIRVPKLQQVVKVNGEVLYQSAVVYQKEKGFKEYVLNAGGFSPQALKRRAYIVYANGAVKGTSKFLFFNSYPDVKPGSEIYVPKKPAPRIGSTTEAIALTTGLASLGGIIFGILSLRK